MESKTEIPIFGVVLLLAVFVLPPALGWAFGWGGGPWMVWGFGWMWLMPLFMVAFWGIVIWAVVAVVQGVSNSDGSRASMDEHESALDILKRRYAGGEISREEYEEMKGELFQAGRP